MRGENIASDPFNFGSDPLDYLITKTKLTKATVEAETVANRHVDNLIDTIYSIAFGQDAFRLYKWAKDENALLGHK